MLIIEDHPAMACGTQWILEQITGIKVTGFAPTGRDGLRMILEETPGMIFLDMQLPDMTGKDVAEAVKRTHPDIHIIVFTGYDYAPLFNGFQEIGVSGFLSKNASPRQVERMIECILEGETVIPLELFASLRLQEVEVRQAPLVLTEFERKIMGMVAKGMTNAQISKEIFMSTRSVENYLTKIYEKLHVKTRIEAVEKFILGS